MTTSSLSFGVCNWFPEHGDHLVAEADRPKFTALAPAGKVFRCVGREGDWLLLQYGETVYRVSPNVYKPVPPPAFQVGQRVQVGEKSGVIAHVGWHFKNEAPIYLLEIAGKRSSRRYSEHELIAV